MWRACNAILYFVKYLPAVRREHHSSIKNATIAGGVLVLVVLLALVAGRRALKQTLEQAEAPATLTTSPSSPLATAEAASEVPQGFIFGRVTTDDGAIYEGRLRFGGDEESFWGDYFNGFKAQNSWVAQAPLEQLTERRPLQIFGVKVFQWESQVDLSRPFMARLGDIARIEANGRDLRVTLKSGTMFHLDRYAADDFADGVRVWDGKRGVVDFDEGQIRSIDFLHTSRPGPAPDRLHGTVRTRVGDFTGFIQWNRQKGVGSDELNGHTADGELRLRFDTVRSIARNSSDSSQVTLLEGEEIALSGTPEVGPDNLGIYIDDRRYGRVLISWNAFERVDFSPGGSSPAYGDFPTGQPLTGDVTTRDGRRLSGRLVYDLDESETTETLDAPLQDVTYNIPFGMIASIVLPAPEQRGASRPKVSLHSGEVLELELAGDLKPGTGLLIFVDGRKQPEYVRWTEIKQIDFDRPSAMYPPLEKR